MNGFCALGLVLAVTCQAPEFPSGKTIKDRWEVIEKQSTRIGMLHTEIQVLPVDPEDVKTTPSRKIRETMTFNLKRFNETVKLRMVREDWELVDGTLTKSKMEQFSGDQLQLGKQAHFNGKTWVLTDLITRKEKPLPAALEQKPLGLAKLQEQWEKGLPGDYLHFEPLLNTFVITKVQARPTPQGTDLALKPQLLWDDGQARTKAIMQSLASTWRIDRGELIERAFEMQGLGQLTAIPSNRAEANKPTFKMLDIGALGLIPLNRDIPSRPTPDRVIYRLHASDGIDLGQVLPGDDRQQVRSLDGGFVELTASPSKPPPRRIAPPPASEYLRPSKIIDFNHHTIQQMAQRSGAYNDDSWTAAKRLESFVKKCMVPDATAPLGSAADAANSKRGDCRHYALLLCALCRSVAIPARTATGLVYIERSKPEGGRGAYLGFHMWTEVYIDGVWVGLDGTLGQGGISARHIKINDQSWFEEESMAPLAPVLNLVGKLQADVLQVNAGR